MVVENTSSESNNLVNIYSADNFTDEDFVPVENDTEISTARNMLKFLSAIMDNKENIVEGIGKGNGPIDAAFGAIDSITSNKAKLVNYSINAITEGEDALGEVIVKLASDDKTVIGRAVSTDIIEASLRAYVNGLNKL